MLTEHREFTFMLLGHRRCFVDPDFRLSASQYTMSASTDRHDKRIRKKSLRSSLYRPSTKEKARLAAQQVALAILKNAEADDRYSIASKQPQRGNSSSLRLTPGERQGSEPSVESYEEKSVHSTELAVKRGSLRALSEATDKVVLGEDEFVSAHDFDLTTITEDATTMLPSIQPSIGPEPTVSHETQSKSGKRTKGTVRFLPRRRGSKQASHSTGGAAGSKKKLQGSGRSSAEGNAWMCGCCGKVFSSEQAAEVHEDKCIGEVLRRVGAKVDVNPSPSSPPGAIAVSDGAIGERRVRGRSVDFADATEGSVPPLPLSPELTSARHSNMLVKDHKRHSRRRFSSDTDVFAMNRSMTEDDLLLPHSVRQYIVLTDEALVAAVQRAAKLLLTPEQIRAERELELLSRDKAWYDTLAEQAEARRTRREYHRSDGDGALSKLQNKFVDAYQLIKEGDDQGGGSMDQYTRKNKGGGLGSGDIVHDADTLYVNVMVRQSIRVVRNELERLAKERWEDMGGGPVPGDGDRMRFERFRKVAHGNLVKLAGLALASDFTPRRVAVQLSNDLYRLVGPRLKKHGVTIETELEYRVGPYFVLGVNIQKIDWTKLMKYTHRDVMLRRELWEQERRDQQEHLQDVAESDEEDEPKKSRMTVFVVRCRMIWQISGEQAIAAFLARLYYLHWTISIPICFVLYHVCFRSMTRRFILTTVVDDIFSYIEEKGMEMEVQIMGARRQASLMLSALRELREDSRELKKKREATDGSSQGTLLGPLLGPAIKDDKGPVPSPPPGFELPDNLEYVGLEVDLPVGFKRLRWAMLSSKSKFVPDAVVSEGAKCLDIKFESWSKHDEHIGAPSLPAGVSEDDFIGADRQTEFLMPKSAFVKANMAFETNTITAYNDYCFCIKKRTRNPDVPYGSTFVAWTQLVFVNTGDSSCHMTCSVEAEFPNGPPLVGRQIQSGMRAGTADFFVLIGETIEKYANEYP